jgi:hypothetical protein
MQYDRATTPPRRRKTPGRIAKRPLLWFGMLAGIAGSAALGPSARAADPPAPLSPPTAAVGGWTTWTGAAGPSFLTPCLAADAKTGTLHLASVGVDLSVNDTRLTASTPAATSPGLHSFLPPVIVSDGTGGAHLVVTGTDANLLHSQFRGDAWSTAVPTGLASLMPPAAALESDGSALELVAVGPDGVLRHSRFTGGAWSNPTLLTAVSFIPPTLAANPKGGVDLAVVGFDRQVYHTHFDGRQWAPYEPTGVFTDMAPAVAVGADGVVHLAATGLDQRIVHGRLVNQAWTAPAPTGVQSDLSPVIAVEPESGVVDLLARGVDRTLQHTRFLSNAWTAPVSLRITTDLRPALTAERTGGVAAAVTATDGRVYVSHFAGTTASDPSPTPAPTTPPSFARDILRIFTNNGVKTCAQAGCHSGTHPQAGQNLDKDHAYTSIVNVTSSEQPKLKRVLPGDAANSYLYQKVAAGLMPRTGGPLTPADIDLIRQWINAGAPNN